tara:strand:+ start:38543 stop:39304 length:762 start_codon:yes stop_codon:yes gene_type:complete
MFHVISKILFVFSTPIVWICILFVLGIILKNSKKKKRFLITGLLTLYLFSNSFVFDEIVGIWEPGMNTVSTEEKYDLAIVLGGYSSYAPAVNQVNFGTTADRLNCVLPLYQSGKIKRILLSGGAGNLYDFNGAEANYINEYLKSIGIKSRHVIVEPNSKNTYQNAVEAKKVIDSLDIEGKVLLITSTIHMKRSSACFQKQKIEFDEYRVDGLTGERKFYFDHLFIPNAETLFKWNIIIHEWLGLISYKIAGYI